MKKRFDKTVRNTPFQPTDVGVYLKYGKLLDLRVLIPKKLPGGARELLEPWRDAPVTNIRALLGCIKKLTGLGVEVIIYPDAEEYINTALYLFRVKQRMDEIRKDPENHPLRKTLLNAELLPYQLDGIAFAVGAGRAVLTNDMGLEKIIQGIGVAELLSRDVDISKELHLSGFLEITVALGDSPVFRKVVSDRTGQRRR